MAWISDSHDGSAGKFLDLLDSLLVAVFSTWSVYDSGFAANEKVYRCYDPAADPVIDFYLHVKDNQANYVEILMYDSWDIASHSYLLDTGCKVIWGQSASYPPYIAKGSSGYYFRSAEHDFVYIDKGEWEANYVGSLLPFSSSWKAPFQMIVLITSSTGYASGYNPIASAYNSAGNSVAKALMGSGGFGGRIVKPFAYQCTYLYFKTSDGKAVMNETRIYDEDSKLILGKLNGIKYNYNAADYVSDDFVTIDADTWRYVEGTYGTKYSCFIKQNV